MRRAAIASLFMLLNIMVVSAQTVLSGKITDTIGTPLPNISVLVHKAGSSTISAYAFSDIDGYYKVSFNCDADSIDVQTNSIFYKQVILRKENRTQSIDFVLIDEVQQLKGVTVTARPIEQRNDTLEYFVGSFAQQEDKSIEDVLKRMPGIEVSDNGKITYQGAPIQKFYVEGMDLTDGRYASISKNLPHQSVASVEIYENHQPIKMLEDKVSSEQASLNIKLSRNVAMTGSGSVGIGAPFLWNASVTPMIFTNKVQMVASYQTNNTGNDVRMFMNRMTYEQHSSERPSENDVELAIQKPNPPLLDQRRYLDNTSHLANFNVLFPISETTQLRTNIYYFNDFQRQTAKQETTLYLPNLTNDKSSYTETIENKLYDQQVFGTITINRNDKHFYLDNKVDFSKRWNSLVGNLVNNANDIQQELNQQAGAISNDLRVIFPMGNHIFDFVSYNSYGVVPETLEVEPGMFAEFINNNVAYLSMKQELVKDQFFTDESFSGIFTLGKINMSAKAGVSHLNKKAKSELLTFKNDVSHYFTKPYVQTNFEYKYRRMTITFNLPVSLNIAEIKSQSSDRQSIEKVFVNPSLSLNLKAGNFWAFRLSGKFEQSIENFEHYYDNYVLKNYNSIMIESAPLSVSDKIRGNARIEFKQPFISLNSTLSYNYQHRQSDMMYKYYINDNGASVLQMVEQPNSSDYHIMNAMVKKFFSPLKTTLALKGNMAFTKNHTILNDNKVALSSISTSLSPNMMIKITEWMHIDYSLNWNLIISKVDGEKRNDVKYIRHNCDVLVFPGKSHLFCITSEIYDYQRKVFLYMDISYRYSLYKRKLDFEMKFSNIFNNDKYISYFTGTFSLMESVYTLRPREILCSVKFRF